MGENLMGEGLIYGLLSTLQESQSHDKVPPCRELDGLHGSVPDSTASFSELGLTQNLETHPL